MTALLTASGLTKTYGQVAALRGADFELNEGEIVALIGDNGAGKSTLAKALTGVISPDSGEIRIRGELVSFSNPADARDHGIEVVHQDLGLAPDLSPVENLFVGREVVRKGPLGAVGVLDHRRMRLIASSRFADYGLKLQDPNAPVATLSGGQRQSIAVIKAVSERKLAVFMDEPTAALGVEQTAKVLGIIRKVRDEGSAVVLISHDLPMVLGVADRIQILRLGQRVADISKADATLELLVDKMAGVAR